MAVCDTYVFPGFLTQVLTRISFQSHQILFSHASAEVRGKNMRERNIASTGSQTHNHHKVMSLTHSPLSPPGLDSGTFKWILFEIKWVVSEKRLIFFSKILLYVILWRPQNAIFLNGSKWFLPWKHCTKRKKCCLPAICLFPHKVFKTFEGVAKSLECLLKD